MNDFLEVQHGLDCLLKTYRESEAGKAFKSAINDIFEGILTEVEQLFDGWIPHFQTNTYFTCFSEHKDSEDSFGRLSMWRAYSETTGVAFVMNSLPFVTPSQALKAYVSPVAYLSDQEFEKEFLKIAENIINDKPFLKQQDRQIIIKLIFNAFKYAVLCTKHPGFAEEIEWRVVYSPSLEESEHLKKEIIVVRGVPQPIYKIPLKDIPDEGLIGIEIPALIDRIIIGPTQYPQVMYEAFSDLLLEAGVRDPRDKIFISSIPLR
ncbi:MAG: DUF2971 domain-containing protein [Deltaproteobacteria bacterium]|nr:DUF2971 domain-containing protein [Deltaproteobacteria bacterium]MBI4794270.1 DUF2971 domain-containing protein [Deltaproteobacteria bacterium]